MQNLKGTEKSQQMTPGHIAGNLNGKKVKVLRIFPNYLVCVIL